MYVRLKITNPTKELEKAYAAFELARVQLLAAIDAADVFTTNAEIVSVDAGEKE